MWGWIKFEATGRQSGQRDRDTMLIQNKEMERSWYVMICLWTFGVTKSQQFQEPCQQSPWSHPDGLAMHATKARARVGSSIGDAWLIFRWSYPLTEKRAAWIWKKTSWSMQHDYFPMFFSIISLLFPPMISLCFPYDVPLFRLLFPYDVPIISLLMS